MANTTFSDLTMYGQQYNIGIANTYGTNVLHCSNLEPSMMIIAVPPSTEYPDEDMGLYSLLATDSQGNVARLTYTIKSGNGVDTVSEKDIVRLNIDGKSIKADAHNDTDGTLDPDGKTLNTLWVDSTNIIDNYSIGYYPSKDNSTYLTYVSCYHISDQHNGVGNNTLVTYKFTTDENDKHTYLSVVTENLSAPIYNNETKTYTYNGVVKPDNDTLIMDDDGTLHVRFKSLTDGPWGEVKPEDFDINPLPLIVSVPDSTGGESLTIVEDNLRHSDNTTDKVVYGTVIGDRISGVDVKDGVITVDAARLGLGSENKLGVYKVDGNTISVKTKTLTTTGAGYYFSEIINAAKLAKSEITDAIISQLLKYNAINCWNTDTDKTTYFEVTVGFLRTNKTTIKDELSEDVCEEIIEALKDKPNKEIIRVNENAALYDVIYNHVLLKSNNSTTAKILNNEIQLKYYTTTENVPLSIYASGSGSTATETYYHRQHVVSTGQLQVNTENLTKATSERYGTVRIAPTNRLYITTSGDLDIRTDGLQHSSSSQYGTVKIDEKSLILDKSGHLCVQNYNAFVVAIQSLQNTVDNLNSEITALRNEIIEINNNINNSTSKAQFTQNGAAVTSIAMIITSGTNLYQTANINVTTNDKWYFSFAADCAWIRSVSMSIKDSSNDGKLIENYGSNEIEQLSDSNVIIKVYVTAFTSETPVSRTGNVKINIYNANTINGTAESNTPIYSFNIVVNQSAVVLVSVREIRNNVYNNFVGLIGQYVSTGSMVPYPSQGTIEAFVKRAFNFIMNSMTNGGTDLDRFISEGKLVNSTQWNTRSLATNGITGDWVYKQLKNNELSNYNWQAPGTNVSYINTKVKLRQYMLYYGMLLVNGVNNPAYANQLYNYLTAQVWFTSPVILPINGDPETINTTITPASWRGSGYGSVDGSVDGSGS